ncbi:hypothetical protein [Lysobacter arvi]|uniref:Uncharacterized protein n=1 Tax=Lysobacter arvi TaxID=3038776 RepID=A0ABU1CBL9_9GAMM|nr:hypothetical protein [Lysobacter arvi]MDR0182584.1 hypothetical protein [Lysobacter arvi]
MKRWSSRMRLSRPLQWLLAGSIVLAVFVARRDGDQDADAPPAAKEASTASAPRRPPATPPSAQRTLPAPAPSSAPAHAALDADVAADPARRSPAPSPMPPGAPGTDAVVNLFPSQSWVPPPPPPPPAPPPPPPPKDPPPLPFSVAATWLERNGEFYAVLTAAGRDFAICSNCRKTGFHRAGDVLLGTYRIESVSAREVQLQYLPLKRTQQMSLGG